MDSISTTLGLRPTITGASPPSLASSYMIFHFIFGYLVLSTRFVNRYYGLEHNCAPREDLEKYGPPAVSSGKMTQKQLDTVKRMQAAHHNSIENYPLFVAAMIWSTVAGLPAEQINKAALMYTGLRFAYALAYILADTEASSKPRGLFWWAGNFVCFRLLWIGGSAVNGKLAAA